MFSSRRRHQGVLHVCSHYSRTFTYLFIFLLFARKPLTKKFHLKLGYFASFCVLMDCGKNYSASSWGRVIIAKSENVSQGHRMQVLCLDIYTRTKYCLFDSVIVRQMLDNKLIFQLTLQVIWVLCCHRYLLAHQIPIKPLQWRKWRKPLLAV